MTTLKFTLVPLPAVKSLCSLRSNPCDKFVETTKNIPPFLGNPCDRDAKIDLQSASQNGSSSPAHVQSADFAAFPERPSVQSITTSLSGCIQSTRPSVISMGEDHHFPPDLVTLGLLKTMVGAGQNPRLALEMPVGMQPFVDAYVRGDISEHDVGTAYRNFLLQRSGLLTTDPTIPVVKSAAFNVPTAEEVQGNAYGFHALLYLAKEAARMGVPSTCIDGDFLPEKIEIFPGEPMIKSTFPKDRDIFMHGQLAAMAPSADSPVIVIDGYTHGREIANADYPDFPQSGIKGSVSLISLISRDLGPENVLSVALPIPAGIPEKLRYESFDRVVNWGDQRPHLTAALYARELREQSNMDAYNKLPANYKEADQILSQIRAE